MSVIVKDMDMPNGCLTCDLHYHCYGFVFDEDIEITDEMMEVDSRLDTCPLIEVPTIKDCLFDIDELNNTLSKHNKDVLEYLKENNIDINDL